MMLHTKEKVNAYMPVAELNEKEIIGLDDIYNNRMHKYTLICISNEGIL